MYIVLDKRNGLFISVVRHDAERKKYRIQEAPILSVFTDSSTYAKRWKWLTKVEMWWKHWKPVENILKTVKNDENIEII